MPVLTKINTNVIADNAVTAAKTDQGADSSLSGTISGQRLQLSDEFTLTGDLTVNDDLVLGKVTDDGTGQSLTGSGKTITGTGTLTMGSSVTDRVKEFNKLTGNVTAPSLILTPSSAPSSPSEGQIYYNNAEGVVYVYNGSTWKQMNTPLLSATGGTITNITGYKVHTFTISGTFTPTSSGSVEYLVIAGGGGTSNSYAGAGAGGYRTNVSGESSGELSSAEAIYNVTAQDYTITIGAGGTGSSGAKNNGVNSSIVPASGTSIISLGGGAGGHTTTANATNAIGVVGGSGGGTHGSHWTIAVAAGTANQGFSGGYGGDGETAFTAGGGGGGAGSVGQSVTNTTNPGTGAVVRAAGGAGIKSSITGTQVGRAGGGGGYRNGTSAGTGTASHGAIAGQSGGANTGAGGSADGSGLSSGGSGIVIIRYAI